MEDPKELKKVQGQFFKNVYKLLIDKEKGPRLYLFIYAIDPERYVKLLDFSTPMTAEEKQPVPAAEPAEEPVKKQVQYGEPDPVEPVREEITMEDFARMDMRVCKILKCTEIRKSHSCYKPVSYTHLDVYKRQKQDGADSGGLCPAVGGKEKVQLGAGQFTQISLCGISHDDDGKNDLIGGQAEQKSGQNRSIHSKQSAQRIQKASETGEKGGVVCSRQVGQKPDQQPGRNGSQNSAAEHFGGAVQQLSLIHI